jgi:hypothetical protein
MSVGTGGVRHDVLRRDPPDVDQFGPQEQRGGEVEVPRHHDVLQEQLEPVPLPPTVGLDAKYSVSRDIPVQHIQSVGIFQYKIFSQ